MQFYGKKFLGLNFGRTWRIKVLKDAFDSDLEIIFLKI